MVVIGTDCSGMETPIMALRNLGIKNLQHAFSCDISAAARKTIEANYPPKVFFDDLMARNNSAASTPKVDLYIAGFPCQPFSAAGKQQGFGDEAGRGTIFWGVRDYIKNKRPKVFVLENVSGLIRLKKGEYFEAIMSSLKALGNYNLYHQVINTKDHGVAQNRKRIYIIGIQRSIDKGTFTFPEPLPATRLTDLLDPPVGKVDASMLPPKSSGTAYRNTLLAIKKLQKMGRDPFREPWVVDIDSSTDRMKFMYDLSPCLTCSRAAGHWITNRGRRMNVREQGRCQTVDVTKNFKVAVTERQLGFQLGNAMSVNVLERIFVRLLPACGLAKSSALTDRWEVKAKRNRNKPVLTNVEVKLQMAKASARSGVRSARGKLTAAAAMASDKKKSAMSKVVGTAAKRKTPAKGAGSPTKKRRTTA